MSRARDGQGHGRAAGKGRAATSQATGRWCVRLEKTTGWPSRSMAEAWCHRRLALTQKHGRTPRTVRTRSARAA
eukprot:7839304-Alexandrium_andersonii.AAC.1